MTRLSDNKITVNPLKTDLSEGRVTVGSWLTLCSPVAAEAMAAVGWDWLVVDAEHSPVGFETMTNCFRAIQLGGAAPIARVPWNDTIWIQRTLDAGAFGLVVPMVQSAEEAALAVANTLCGTAGIRSFGGSRLEHYIRECYPAWANRNRALIVQIETMKAVERIEEILSVPGVDAGFIGPTDLGLSMGWNPGDPAGIQEIDEAIARALEGAKRVGVPMGIFCFSAEQASQRIQQGFIMPAVAAEKMFMETAAKAAFAAVKK